MMKVKRCTECGFTYVEEVIKCPACNVLLLDDEIPEKPNFVKKDEYDGVMVKPDKSVGMGENAIFKIVKLNNGYFLVDYDMPEKSKSKQYINLYKKKKLDELFKEKILIAIK